LSGKFFKDVLPLEMIEIEQLSEVIDVVKNMSLINQRAIAAVIGAAVGDAACRPLHWVFDVEVLKSTLNEADPEFWPVNASPFYALPSGRRSCYNEEAYCMLRCLSLPENTMPFEKHMFVSSLVDFFAAPSEYSEAAEKKKLLPPYNGKSKNPKNTILQGPWQNDVISKFMDSQAKGASHEGNSESTDIDGFTSIIPLVARMAAQGIFAETFKTLAKEASQILVSNRVAISYSLSSALILKHCIQSPVEEAGLKRIQGLLELISADQTIEQEVSDAMMEVVTAVESQENFVDAVQRWGSHCVNPGCFMGAVFAIASSDSYAQGIRSTIKAGGCNCSRANFVGACLGAMYGFDEDRGIPLDWICKTHKAQEIMNLAIERVPC